MSTPEAARPTSGSRLRTSSPRWQRFAASVAARAPMPTPALSALRAEVVDAVLVEHSAAITRARERAAAGIAAVGRISAPSGRAARSDVTSPAGGAAPAHRATHLPAPGDPSAADTLGGPEPVGISAADTLADPGPVDPSAAATDPDPEPFAGAHALAALAEHLVHEVRARTTALAASAGLLPRLLAAVDARLPTDAVEWMDRPDLPAPRRERLVASLHAWNLRFGNYARFAELVAPLLREGDTVLDLAAGHGGFARALRALVPTPRFRVVASDRDPTLVAAARAHAGIPDRCAPDRCAPDWRVLDALRLARDLHPGDADVLTCTSALHHFGAGGAVIVLAQALARARAVVVVDLARSATRLVAGATLARLGDRDGALAHDTAVSFRRAFTRDELRLLTRLVPGGDRLETGWLAPGFVFARTRPGP